MCAVCPLGACRTVARGSRLWKEGGQARPLACMLLLRVLHACVRRWGLAARCMSAHVTATALAGATCMLRLCAAGPSSCCPDHWAAAVGKPRASVLGDETFACIAFCCRRCCCRRCSSCRHRRGCRDISFAAGMRWVVALLAQACEDAAEGGRRARGRSRRVPGGWRPPLCCGHSRCDGHHFAVATALLAGVLFVLPGLHVDVPRRAPAPQCVAFALPQTPDPDCVAPRLLAGPPTPLPAPLCHLQRAQ